MSKLNQKQTGTQTQSGVDTELKNRFSEVQESITTRQVKLIYSSCCGCGCTDVAIYRNVPVDSTLQNGDRINSLEANDSRYPS